MMRNGSITTLKCVERGKRKREKKKVSKDVPLRAVLSVMKVTGCL